MRYRRRKEAVEKLRECIDCDDVAERGDLLKEAMEAFAGYRFRTADGVRFDYVIHNDGLRIVDGDAYSREEILEMIEDGRKIRDERMEVVLRRIGVDVECIS